MLGAYVDGYRSAERKLRGVVTHVNMSDSSPEVKAAVREIILPIANDFERVAICLDTMIETVRGAHEVPPAPTPGQFKPNEVII